MNIRAYRTADIFVRGKVCTVEVRIKAAGAEQRLEKSPPQGRAIDGV